MSTVSPADPSKKERCLWYDTKLHLMVRLQFWSMPSLPLFPVILSVGVVVTVRILSMAPIDLFAN